MSVRTCELLAHWYVNRSVAAEALLFAFPTLALTSTTPGFFAELVVITQLVVELQSTEPAGDLPNSKTVVVPRANPLPVIVTVVPPAAGPALGLTLEIVGASYLKRSFVDDGLEPLGVVTLTSTVSVVDAGETAVIEVAESTVKVAAREPKSTALAALKPAPVIVTLVPPAAGPLLALIFVTIGGGT
jgi:hypothetical protein